MLNLDVSDIAAHSISMANKARLASIRPICGMLKQGKSYAIVFARVATWLLTDHGRTRGKAKAAGCQNFAI